MKYLDFTGLEYFYSKLKKYIDETASNVSSAITWNNINGKPDYLDDGPFLPLTGGTLTGSVTSTGFLITGKGAQDIVVANGTTISFTQLKGELDVPTQVSDLVNDVNYVTKSIADSTYATITTVNNKLDPEDVRYTASQTSGTKIGSLVVNGTSTEIYAPSPTTAYSLPTASSTVKGGVKIGSGLQMSGEILSVDYNTIPNKPAAYSLPVAGVNTLGGIKVGSGLNISPDGVLSATGGGTADAVSWANVTGKPSGLVTSVSISGSGNAVTNASFSDGTLTLTRGTIEGGSGGDGNYYPSSINTSVSGRSITVSLSGPGVNISDSFQIGLSQLDTNSSWDSWLKQDPSSFIDYVDGQIGGGGSGGGVADGNDEVRQNSFSDWAYGDTRAILLAGRGNYGGSFTGQVQQSGITIYTDTSRNSSIRGCHGIEGDGSIRTSLTEIWNTAGSTTDLSQYALKSEVGTSGNYISKSGDSGMTGNYTYSSSSRITAGEFYETSDRNLKENISQISEEDVNKARNIDIVEFNFKGKDTKKYGVIAQDLESAGLENLVQSNEEGTKSVDYISMLCLKIAELEKRIKELENGRK